MPTLTLRADLIETAARAAKVGGWAPSGTNVASWLETSGAAGALAGRHGLTRDGLQDAVDGMSWTRIVRAVARAVEA